MIIINEDKKYGMIYIYIEELDELCELFNQLLSCIKNSDKENEIEINEEIDKDNLLEEWEKKIIE